MDDARPLRQLEDMAALASRELTETALAMARGQWPWGGAVLAALGIDPEKQNNSNVGRPIRIVDKVGKPIKEITG